MVDSIAEIPATIPHVQVRVPGTVENELIDDAADLWWNICETEA